MILARIDPKDKGSYPGVHPRDTQIQLGHGTQKINAAYAFGGLLVPIKAVEDLAGVSIPAITRKSTLMVFAAVVDSLGGIAINVQYEINDPELHGISRGWSANFERRAGAYLLPQPSCLRCYWR